MNDEWWMMNDECPKKKEFCIGKCCAVILGHKKVAKNEIPTHKEQKMTFYGPNVDLLHKNSRL